MDDRERVRVPGEGTVGFHHRPQTGAAGARDPGSDGFRLPRSVELQVGDHQFEELPDHRQPWVLGGRIPLRLLSGVALGDSRVLERLRASRMDGLPAFQCVLQYRVTPVPSYRLPNPRRNDGVECAAADGRLSRFDVLLRPVHRVDVLDGADGLVARADLGALGMGGGRWFPAAADPASRALHCARVHGRDLGESIPLAGALDAAGSGPRLRHVSGKHGGLVRESMDRIRGSTVLSRVSVDRQDW